MRSIALFYNNLNLGTYYYHYYYFPGKLTNFQEIPENFSRDFSEITGI